MTRKRFLQKTNLEKECLILLKLPDQSALQHKALIPCHSFMCKTKIDNNSFTDGHIKKLMIK